jgi:hypothetical protein
MEIIVPKTKKPFSIHWQSVNKDLQDGLPAEKGICYREMGSMVLRQSGVP